MIFGKTQYGAKKTVTRFALVPISVDEPYMQVIWLRRYKVDYIYTYEHNGGARWIISKIYVKVK